MGTLIFLLIPQRVPEFSLELPIFSTENDPAKHSRDKAWQQMLRWDNSAAFPKCRHARGILGHARPGKFFNLDPLTPLEMCILFYFEQVS